jgi:urease accessory protein
MSSPNRTASVTRTPALRITARQSERRPANARLVLPFEQRARSRFRARLDSGEEIAVMLSRGQILRDADLLLASDGRVVEVKAALEVVSTARTEDMRMLALAAYHLGNRHVALQVGPAWLRYLHDHVLDDMVARLGLPLFVEHAPFEPEAGPYHTHAHAQAHHSAAPAFEHEHELEHDPGDGP